MVIDIYHSGVGHDGNPPGRGSGRYAWGSGENPNQHNHDLLTEVKKLRDQGFTQSEIARALLGQKGVNKQTGEPIWCNSTDLRAAISIANTDQRKALRAQALKLYDECHGNVSEVARRMGKNESSVRSLLKDSINKRQGRYEKTAEFLKQKIDEQGVIDISSGVESIMGLPAHVKDVAVAMLVQEGYVKTWVQLDQQFGQGNKTTMKVLARKPQEGETDKDVRSWVQHHKYEVGSIVEFTPDESKTFWTPEFPAMLDPKRVKIRYAEDGGKDKDGVIELRRGVEDISLDGSQYAQVRIGVNGTHYLKGMAMYGEDSDFPKGIDVIFNTNKHAGTPMLGEGDNTVLKHLKTNDKGEVDRDNPFGALIKSPKEVDGILMAGGQRHYIDKDGKEKLSPINKLRDEGDWDSWSRTLSSQFLSKQPLKLIHQQIDISVKDKKAELDEIMSLTNPVIKKKMLEDFAEQTDSSAARLSTKGFKGQAFQVLLPLPDISVNEIYAPMYKDGDTVALIRYPHGGTFEIPVLTVNNKSESGKNRITSNAKDAVGINPKTAAQLSGADFDGDTAAVIPLKSNNLSVAHKKYFDELAMFDPKELYSLPEGTPKIKDRTKQKLMGEVTNLITDMTVGGATAPEIVRAVKHSMVVIDAQKHNLDYKQSAIDNNIADLKRKYQGTNSKGQPGGASTILSQAHATTRVNQRKELTDTKKMTPEQLVAWNRGEIVYVETGKMKQKMVADPRTMTDEERATFRSGNKVYRRVEENGKTKRKLVADPTGMTQEEWDRFNAGKKVYRQSNEKVQEQVHRMDVVDDAMKLVHDPNNPKEVAYAKYANTLKDLANQARKTARSIKPTPINQEARRTYAEEVASLTEKVRQAKMNSPRERKAQALAGAMVAEKFAADPSMDFEHRQRERARSLIVARAAVGAKKDPVIITDREWEAIQANAVSTSLLQQILSNTDQDGFKQRATPHNKSALSPAFQDLARSMASSGHYTNADIAERCGVSASAIAQFLNQEGIEVERS